MAPPGGLAVELNEVSGNVFLFSLRINKIFSSLLCFK